MERKNFLKLSGLASLGIVLMPFLPKRKKNVFYMTQSGNGNGTFENPWNIDKFHYVMSHLSEGQTLIFKGGVYQ
jgi:hypothetical protein